MKRFKIVFMGTPEFAVPSLKALLDGTDEIVSVVTQPDRRRGRGKKLSPSPVKTLALERGVPILQPEKARDPGFIDEIREISPDFLVVAAYGQILSQELLDAPKIMPINVHGSLLPKYRGAAPIQWAIMACETETGITIMKMDAGMDTGPMLMQESLKIGGDETFGELYKRMAKTGASLLLKALDALREDNLPPIVQPEKGISYAPPIKPEMTRIDWSLPAKDLSCLMRALDPKPGAFTTMEGKKIRLFSPAVQDNKSVSESPGTVLKAGKEGVLISTGKGLLLAKEILYPGKRRMKVKDFLMGNKIPEGLVFK